MHLPHRRPRSWRNSPQQPESRLRQLKRPTKQARTRRNPKSTSAHPRRILQRLFLIWSTPPTSDNWSSLIRPSDRIGQYFVVALHHHFGEGAIDSEGVVNPSWIDIAKALVANGASIEPSWHDAYFGAFTQGNAAGDRTVVVASAQMPALTASLRFDPPDRLETTAINDACLRVVSYAGIVTGTGDRRAAGRLIDQMISPEFQFKLGDTMGHDRREPISSSPISSPATASKSMSRRSTRCPTVTIWPEWVGVWGLIVADAREAAAVTEEPDDADAAP